MPSNSPEYARKYKRKNYKKLYEADKEHQVASHKARRMMEKKVGKAALKWKDVDHKKPFSKGGKTVLSNLRIVSPKKNRWAAAKLKKKK